MENSLLIYILLAVSVVSLAILVYLALKMKTVVYLLEQPVVKKMSPQLKLKPVKMDEILADRNRNSQPQNREGRPHQHGSAPGNNPRQGGRPDGERRDGNRDRQGARPERAEGERREGGRDGDRNRGGNDRFRDRNRGDRPQGGQGGRPERAEGERRNDGDRRPPREFNDNREPNREQNAPVSQPAQPVMRNEAPVSMPQQDAPLSPRRPLPATVETHDNHNTPTTPSFEGGSEAFVGTDGDMQHGRRTQIKKKPRFEMDEAEVKTEG